MDETTAVTVAESAEMTESQSDDFFKGFEEEFGIEPETTGEPEPEETEPETEKETEDAENAAPEAESEPEMISFKEAGKEFSAPKEAVEAFAKAVGRDTANLIDIYQKGCNYDKLNGRLSEALKDSEAFEKIAALRGTNKEALRTELYAMVEKAQIDSVVARIKTENPGINEATAQELAKYRLNEQKPKAEPVKEENRDSEEDAARLREIDIFQAKHPELGTLPNEAVELWKKSGISLEKAFEAYQNENKVKELEKKIAAMKTEQKKKEQKAYAKETSPGSANSAAGVTEKDPFLEAFSRDY